MTYIEEKLTIIKQVSADSFNIKVERMDRNTRLRKVADSRKCFSFISKKIFPEISHKVISNMYKKERSSSKKALWEAVKLLRTDKDFRKRVDSAYSISLRCIHDSCRYCKRSLSDKE